MVWYLTFALIHSIYLYLHSSDRITKEVHSRPMWKLFKRLCTKENTFPDVHLEMCFFSTEKETGCFCNEQFLPSKSGFKLKTAEYASGCVSPHISQREGEPKFPYYFSTGAIRRITAKYTKAISLLYEKKTKWS